MRSSSLTAQTDSADSLYTLLRRPNYTVQAHPEQRTCRVAILVTTVLAQLIGGPKNYLFFGGQTVNYQNTALVLPVTPIYSCHMSLHSMSRYDICRTMS